MPDVYGSPVLGVNKLTIKVALPGSDFPQVQFIVDGTDRLKHASPSGFEGFSATELLVDETVLLPAAQPRRVALYQCSCGIPGCGSLAPVVGSDGDRVTWTDFRDFTGVFEGPLELTDPDDDDPFSEGRRAQVPGLVFDRAQYEAEVVRAVADKSWESDALRAQRLIAAAIRSHEAERLTAGGLELDDVWLKSGKRGGAAVTIDLRTVIRRAERGPNQQILLDVPVSADIPEGQADEVVGALGSVAVDRWESTFRHRFSARGHRAR